MNEVEEIQISGKKFAQVRRKLVLTQEELAGKLEMSSSNLRRIERSEATTISPKFFRRLAELRGVSLESQVGELSPSDEPPLSIPDIRRALDAMAELSDADKITATFNMTVNQLFKLRTHFEQEHKKAQAVKQATPETKPAASTKPAARHSGKRAG